jgi:hypothetical protein
MAWDSDAGLDGRSDDLARALGQQSHGLSLTGVVLAEMVVGSLGVLADTAVEARLVPLGVWSPRRESVVPPTASFGRSGSRSPSTHRNARLPRRDGRAIQVLRPGMARLSARVPGHPLAPQ